MKAPCEGVATPVCATWWDSHAPIWNIRAPGGLMECPQRYAVNRRPFVQRFPVSAVLAPVDRLVQRIQMWRYEEQHVARARGDRDAGERLRIARVSHLH